MLNVGRFLNFLLCSFSKLYKNCVYNITKIHVDITKINILFFKKQTLALVQWLG